MPRRARGKSTRSSPVTPVYYIPSTVPTIPFENMTGDDVLKYIVNLRDRLAAKKRRERSYLDRRAARGTHTPTDDAYEADQLLENEILALFDHLIKEAGK